ncbi:MAG: DUF305 domain-containing protein [Rubrobacter sp.]
MKHQTRLAVAGLLSAVALTAAACGGAGGDAGNNQGDKGGASSGMVMKDDKYSDERFIDAMVPHHEGAVEMAEVALKNAEHEEIKQLSENIVSTQRTEIEELKEIKQEEFGTSKVPMNMDSGQMEDMGVMADAQELAKQDPFDKAFIDAMTPHHQSAIEMAEVAREKSQTPRIKKLADDIVSAQEKEISQMQTWRENWYPEDN